MNKYRVEGGIHQHAPAHPERSAFYSAGWEYIVGVWPSREAMAKAIRKQARTLSYPYKGPWRAFEPLADNEGY